MMASNLQRLRELTEQLDHSHFIPEYQVGDAFHYDFGHGEAITHGIIHNDEVAIAKLHMKAGTRFPEHTHKALEVFIVLEGEIMFDMCNQEWHIKKGYPFYTLPNIPHGGEAITDCIILCITIPADPSFPYPEGG